MHSWNDLPQGGRLEAAACVYEEMAPFAPLPLALDQQPGGQRLRIGSGIGWRRRVDGRVGVKGQDLEAGWEGEQPGGRLRNIVRR